MRNDKYRALAAALSWTEDEFQAAIEGRPPAHAAPAEPAPAEPASAAPLPAAARKPTSSRAERLRLLRERLGYSLRDVAAHTNGTISYGTVRQIEARDDAELEGATLGTYRALAQAYAMPLTDLLTFVFDESEPPIPAHFAQLMKREATERVVRTAIVDLRYQVRQIEHRLRYLEEQLDETPSE